MLHGATFGSALLLLLTCYFKRTRFYCKQSRSIFSQLPHMFCGCAQNANANCISHGSVPIALISFTGWEICKFGPMKKMRGLTRCVINHCGVEVVDGLNKLTEKCKRLNCTYHLDKAAWYINDLTSIPSYSHSAPLYYYSVQHTAWLWEFVNNSWYK